MRQQDIEFEANNNPIDISYDVRTDSRGKDPDHASQTLKRYHKLLWSKTLPSGDYFNLEYAQDKGYLCHKSKLGEFYLSSDSILHTYSKWKRTQHIITQISAEEIKAFFDIAYTVGGFLIFPGNRINGLNTINQARGTHSQINDRLDLTLECIRRFYKHEESPLKETIERYHDFFALFLDFKGYVENFLLQDLVQDIESNNNATIKFYLPFNGFVSSPLPKNVDEYLIYKKNNLEFLDKRNNRIQEYGKALQQTL
jgi:hypothetical protein